MEVNNIRDGGHKIIGDQVNTKIKKGRTIIDTVFVFDTPKYTYIDRYAPVHAGNSYQKINDIKENLKTIINRKCVSKEKDIIPVAVPRHFKRDIT